MFPCFAHFPSLDIGKETAYSRQVMGATFRIMKCAILQTSLFFGKTKRKSVLREDWVVGGDSRAHTRCWGMQAVR